MKKPLIKTNFIWAIIPVVLVAVLLVWDSVAHSVTAVSNGDGGYYPIDPRWALVAGAAAASIIGVLAGKKWKDVEAGIVKNITNLASSIVVLFLIGGLIAAFTISGVVPTIVYYGLDIVNPAWLIPATFLLTSIVSIALGSSWTTAAIIGAPLAIIGQQLGMNPAIVAGAAISGGYLGDKLSPLSDTTTLAAGSAGTNLFDHIKAMLKPTAIAAAISLVAFTIIGLTQANNGTASTETIQVIKDTILDTYNTINPLLLLPLLLIVPVFIFRLPTIPSLLGIIVVSSIVAIVVQGLDISGVMDGVLFGYGLGDPDASGFEWLANVKGFDGMGWVVSLIICAMVFAGAMDSVGSMDEIMKPLKRFTRNKRTICATTSIMAVALNGLTSDQYTAIAMPAQFVKEDFEELGLDPSVLSQTLEGSGTVSSVLMPWTSCGAYMTGVFAVVGITMWQIVPFVIFNITSVVIAITLPLLGIGLTSKKTKSIK